MVLEVRNLTTRFFTLRGVVRAVEDVSFELSRGETLGVVGESGCGKSTLAWSLMGLAPPPGRIVSGRVFVDGVEITSLDREKLRRAVLWKKISMIFQGAMNALNPVYSVGQQLARIFMYHLGLTKREAFERAKALLPNVGLSPEVVHRYPHELSGGMKQRVVIAMALALNPPVVIADEPTTALDVVVQAQILNLMKRLREERSLSYVLITHDLSVVAELADKVLVMYGGKIMELGPADSLLRRPTHPYTEGLLRSVPRLRGQLNKLEYIPGEPPNLINPPSGCVFHPRCKLATELCKREEPPLVEVEKGHYSRCWLVGG
ncbi:MAG: ABC transporter ATP-binding protein [Fervidicoccaceae archaeon]